jgi:urea transport system permease protein
MIASAQTATLQPILQEHGALIAKSSRKTIAPAIDAIATSGVPQAQVFLEQWAGKNIWMRKSDGVLFIGEKLDAKTYALTDIDGGAGFDGVAKSDLKQLKPNSGVRAMIQSAVKTRSPRLRVILKRHYSHICAPRLRARLMTSCWRRSSASNDC